MHRNDNNPFIVRRHLIQGALGSLILKISQTFLTILLAVVVARRLGVEGFGCYVFCISIVKILNIPAMLGGQNLLLREVATYNAKRKLNNLRGLIILIFKVSGGTSIVIALVAAVIGLGLCLENPMRNSFLIAMILVPVIARINLQGAIIRGLRHLMLGQINNVLLPALIITSVIVMSWFQKTALRPQNVLAAYVISAVLLLIISSLLVHNLLIKRLNIIKPAFETSRWLKSMIPFVFTGGMHVINNEASILLLGLLKGTEAVGLFRVAQRGADLIPFGLTAINLAIAPTVAELFANGEKQRLQNIMDKSVLAVTAFALPLTLTLIFAGPKLIPFIFGKEYSAAYISLVILSAGQLFNGCMGSAGVVLNMAGLEKMVAVGVSIAAFTNVFLNIALIQFYGIKGAAIATTTSIIIWNVLLSLWLYKKTGIISAIRIKHIRSGIF